MAQTRYLTQLYSKRRPVEVDQLTNFDRLLFRTPVNFTILFLLPIAIQNEAPLEKGLRLKIVTPNFGRSLKCAYRKLFLRLKYWDNREYFEYKYVNILNV